MELLKNVFPTHWLWLKKFIALLQNKIRHENCVYRIYSNKCPLSYKHHPLFMRRRLPNVIQKSFRTLKFLYICPYFISRTSFLGLANSGAHIRTNAVNLKMIVINFRPNDCFNKIEGKIILLNAKPKMGLNTTKMK